jgi:hypothetical protein
MKGSILFLSVFFLSLNCFTQETTQKRSPHYFGLHAGSTTAYGLSYRYWPSKFGIEFTTLPTFKKYMPIDESFINSKISTGLSILYTIKKSRVVDLYTYVGGFTLFEKKYEAYYSPLTFQTEYLKKEQLDLNLGIGLAVKFKFIEVLDFNLQLGYGMYKINQPDQFYSLVSGEVGLYYNF